ncbi:hypothetical protein [Zunongwangia atlantica]|uniref:Transmembrane protein n=1 Tax=Zunongwangia atlantica 22II14-10F7 TaxID=1185767 RepID=A0A1Y1T5I1_9FLAO|nr:hypothetical protein [Zunongwangia atlantica]ORL46301.1 hypothetical protein IIF7_07016 [Zunongwangia atlantica 22II14-10F7]
MKIIFHLIIFIFLTILTQVGGIIYLASITLIRRNKRILQLFVFLILYALSTFLIIPTIAPYFGREKIKESQNVKLHSIFYKIANRNYVRPELNSIIENIGNSISRKHPGLKLTILDANFPFKDGFPLLPHLSHNDGKKVDISLMYRTKEGVLTNEKPSNSGYGVFENPLKNEINQTTICKNNGAWQYDYPKYLTFGKNLDLEFSANTTKDLIQSILENNEIQKIFLEPHLKNRLNINSEKMRFHGCRAVRHDDHLHLQIQ